MEGIVLARKIKNDKNSGGLEKNLEVRLDETKNFELHPSAVFDFSRYVCQVIVAVGNGSATRGTGFLVGPDLLLTCFHVIENVDIDDLECRFDAKVNELGESMWGPRVAVTAVEAFSSYSTVEAEGKYNSESKRHPEKNELDYALLRLSAKVGYESVEVQHETVVKRDWLKLHKSPPIVDTETEISILQHPGGDGQRAARGLRAEEQPPGNTRLRYLVQTENGSSGSPCFQWNNEDTRSLMLVAMHNYGDPGWAGKSQPFNHGIPIHLIHLDLDKQLPGWNNFSADEIRDNTVSTTSEKEETKENEFDKPSETDSASKLLDSTEAAQYLNINSKSTSGKSLNLDKTKVSNLARQGTLVSHQKTPGSPHYFDRNTLDRFLAQPANKPIKKSSFIDKRDLIVGSVAGLLFGGASLLIPSDPIGVIQKQKHDSDIGLALRSMFFDKTGPFEVTKHRVRFMLIKKGDHTDNDLKYAEGKFAVVCSPKLKNYLITVNGGQLGGAEIPNTKAGEFYALLDSQLACGHTDQSETEGIVVDHSVFNSIFFDDADVKPEPGETFDATIDALLVQR